MTAPQPHTTEALTDWLLKLRQHTEQRQEDLARVIDVHRVTISDWENGRGYPSASSRLRLNAYAREVGFPPIPPKLRRT